MHGGGGLLGSQLWATVGIDTRQWYVRKTDIGTGQKYASTIENGIGSALSAGSQQRRYGREPGLETKLVILKWFLEWNLR